MKSHFVLAISVLLCVGCSHSRFVLHDPARRGSPDSNRFELTSKDRLAIYFRADGSIDSTCAEVDGETRLAMVKAIEADENFLLLSSEEWKSVRQIPRRYLSMSKVRVRSPGSGYDKPTVALSLAAIQEIRVEGGKRERPPVSERLDEVPRWVLQGAVGGFVGAVSFLYPSRYRDHLDSDDREVLIAGSVIGGVGGAVLYPAARLFLPQKTWRSHRARGQGFRLKSGTDP